MKRCPDCKTRFSKKRFYSEKSVYCKECQKIRRKKEYAALTPEQLEKRKIKRNTPRYQAWRKRYEKRYKASMSKERYAAMHRRGVLKHRYGVTPEWYDAKLAEQGGHCALCPARPNGKRLAVDHDHKCCSGRKSCGKCLRGLLCQKCNAILGHLETHPELFTKLREFVNDQRSSNPGLSDQAPNGARWP